MTSPNSPIRLRILLISIETQFSFSMFSISINRKGDLDYFNLTNFQSGNARAGTML